jgi:hypothetical protein
MIITVIIGGIIVYLWLCCMIGKFCGFNDRMEEDLKAKYHTPHRAFVTPLRRPDLTNTTGRNP